MSFDTIETAKAVKDLTPLISEQISEIEKTDTEKATALRASLDLIEKQADEIITKDESETEEVASDEEDKADDVEDNKNNNLENLKIDRNFM